MKKILFLAFLLNLSVGFTQTEAALRQKANDLAHRFIIIDTHIDVPYRMLEKWEIGRAHV